MLLLHNHPMNLRHLRTFVAVADMGGFARATSRLHVSQPAASRQIDALESELGVVLFERKGRGIRLTSHGEYLLRQSRLVLTEADSLRQRAQVLKKGRTGILRLGATPQVIENLVAVFLEHFCRRHPGIDVRLVEDGGARLPVRLDQGDVDLAIMPVGDQRFDGQLLYPMHVFAVMAKTHPLSGRTTLDVTDLANNRLLVGSGFASRAWLEAACLVAHVKPNIVLESTAPHTLIALAKAGYGIGVLPSPASIRGEAVRAVPLVHRGISIGRWAVVAWNAPQTLAPYAEQFVQDLVAYCRKKFPGRDLIRHSPPLPKPKFEAGGQTRAVPRR